MNKQLTGLAWIFFGMSAALIGIGSEIGWKTFTGELLNETWGIVSLACGLIGLVPVSQKLKGKD